MSLQRYAPEDAIMMRKSADGWWADADEAEQRIRELTADLAAALKRAEAAESLNKIIVCAFCGHKEPKPPNVEHIALLMATHIAECKKHPMRDAVVALRSSEASVAAMREAAKAPIREIEEMIAGLSGADLRKGWQACIAPLKAALSSDAGKGWHSPREWALMRDAIRVCQERIHSDICDSSCVRECVQGKTILEATK